MKKLFTVTEDMNSMTHDQLKGAVRNMETISNAMYAAMEELLSKYCSSEFINVLTMNFDYWSENVQNVYVPDVDGNYTIIPRNRPDLLVRWKLHFFSKYGNMNLAATFENDGKSVHCTVEEWNNRDRASYSKFNDDMKERSRSDAALYESMSKKTKF